jgi:hypothetical protein
MRRHVRQKHADLLDAEVLAASAFGVRDKSANNTFVCPLKECGHGFRWRRDLLRHFREKHWEQRAVFPDAVARHHLKCNYHDCEATFARLSARQNHELKTHRIEQRTAPLPPIFMHFKCDFNKSYTYNNNN